MLLFSLPPRSYPYRDGRFPADTFPSDVVLGVQCNICIDDFRSDNAATMFCPGSHLAGGSPPPEYNKKGDEGWLPPEAVQIEAPAGSAIVYDSRMWHQACPWLNTGSTSRRQDCHFDDTPFCPY